MTLPLCNVCKTRPVRHLWRTCSRECDDTRRLLAAGYPPEVIRHLSRDQRIRLVRSRLKLKNEHKDNANEQRGSPRQD